MLFPLSNNKSLITSSFSDPEAFTDSTLSVMVGKLGEFKFENVIGLSLR
jgi:hypothetical protein